jgi:large subunit ribosomal protein L30
MAKEIRIKLVRSGIGRPRKHRLVLKGLGLKRLNQVVTREDTNAVRGMIRKVSHLVDVAE